MEKYNDYYTTSMCPTCYIEVLAKVYEKPDGSLWMSKECSNHGSFDFMIEKSAKFWCESIHTNKNNKTNLNYDRVSCIEVTDRCNVKCTHCYHGPDNSIKDKPVEWIISRSRMAPTDWVTLMGAEPTVRDDLYQIVEGVRDSGKFPGIYTNGLRIGREPEYLDKLISSGLKFVNMSIHNPMYHGEKIWKRIADGLGKILEKDIIMPQLSFTVTDDSSLEFAVNTILEIRKNNIFPNDYCIRTPSEIGWSFEKEEEIFASQLWDRLESAFNSYGKSWSRHPNYGSNPYHVGAVAGDDITIQVIHWPDVRTIDMRWMAMGPYASFVDGTWGSFVSQIILRDGVKKGWWQGNRIMTNS